MNIFEGRIIYAQPWTVKNVEDMEASEKAQVASAEVVRSKKYPDQLSVCFHMKAGGMIYVSLDKNATVGEGDTVDVNKCKVVTLGRTGDKDIQKILV